MVGVSLIRVGPLSARRGVDEPQVDARLLGQLDQRPLIVQPLVARLVRDDQFAPRVAQLRDQGDRVFDPLSGHDARRLQQHHVVRRQPDPLAEIRLRQSPPPKADSRNPTRWEPAPTKRPRARKIVLRKRVDRHVLDRLGRRRKGHLQKVVHRVDRKSRSLPVEIVMMGDRGDFGLGDEMGQRHAQRNVHRQTQGVLDHQDVDPENASTKS